jgi:hypothetical protein
MREWIAFLLPPATALAGMRLNRLLLGRELDARFGFGLRFALGFAMGALAFSQLLLLGALAGANAATPLGRGVLVWGLVEAVLLYRRQPGAGWRVPLRTAHLWLLLLAPVAYWLWVIGRLSVLESTLEFDAIAFWVFKAKVLYLVQGAGLLEWIRRPDLAYAHWDYPLLVPGLYALGYGAVGAVDDFINKVWPFWMMVSLCAAVLSLARVWIRPRPLPLLTVIILCFLPASLHFVRQEGGTLPMLFYASLAALLLTTALHRSDSIALAAAPIVLAGGGAAKLEGFLYAAAWAAVLVAFRRRLRWADLPLVRRGLLGSGLCLVPYALYRLAGPMPHPESNWWRTGIAAPTATLRRLPQLLLVDVVGRFFGTSFFRWQSPDGDHLEWVGHWQGVVSIVNPELSVLPWLLMAIVTLSLLSRREHRLPLGLLTAVTLGVLAFLSLAIACLPETQASVWAVIDYWSGVVPRYSYPFFGAWFVGAMTLWLGRPNGTNHEAHAEAPDLGGA